nr:immunoglobulin light chain junction region [Macaca mulatta]MOX52428.1 immunoglobulin light chain junction region [Macaca mulatta]MOX53448.1 immunoglobulin light chain junction region [Macaca mulatta]MOX53638.1 immunoglobulin light chain junction region [Macaca mulatta]MOX54326.1 immunoglobulin light chain junction region [Macaca mulatta]
YTQYKHIPPTF